MSILADTRADRYLRAGAGGLGGDPRLAVSYVEDRKHLPIIELRRAGLTNRLLWTSLRVRVQVFDDSIKGRIDILPEISGGQFCGYVGSDPYPVARRIQQGLSKPEILRCLKRYIAREVFKLLRPHADAALSSTEIGNAA